MWNSHWEQKKKFHAQLYLNDKRRLGWDDGSFKEFRSGELWEHISARWSEASIGIGRWERNKKIKYQLWETIMQQQQPAMGSFRFCVGLFVKCDLVWMIKWRNFSHDSHPTHDRFMNEICEYCVIEGWGCCLYMRYLILRI